MLYSELKYLWKVFVCGMKRPAHLISSCNPVLYREKCIFLVPFVWLVMSVRLGKRESECSCGWSSGYTVWIMAWIKTSTQYSSSCVASQLLGKSERWICRKWQMEQIFFFFPSRVVMWKEASSRTSWQVSFWAILKMQGWHPFCEGSHKNQLLWMFWCPSPAGVCFSSPATTHCNVFSSMSVTWLWSLYFYGG